MAAAAVVDSGERRERGLVRGRWQRVRRQRAEEAWQWSVGDGDGCGKGTVSTPDCTGLICAGLTRSYCGNITGLTRRGIIP